MLQNVIVTIIAPNYASQALTLGKSLLRNMPNFDFVTVLIQDEVNVDWLQSQISDYLRHEILSGKHKVIPISNINWGDFDVSRASNQYNLLEFATSIKPAVIRHFLQNGYENVTYLDPDIYVYKDFSPLILNETPIKLTPHILSDFPLDGFTPNQQNILWAGIFNLGFVSFNLEGIQFLNWWSEKLNEYCLMDVANGYHVDQKWMDWAPIFAETQILVNPGLNVAYWNLHERLIFARDKHYFVNQDDLEYPLYFFHFSGFSDFNTFQLTKHGNRNFSEARLPLSILQEYSALRLSASINCVVPEWHLAGRYKGMALPEKIRKTILERKGFKLKYNEMDYRYASKNSLIDFLKTVPELRDMHGDRLIEFLRDECNYSDEIISENIDYIMGKSETCLQLVGYFGAPTGVGQIARNTSKALDKLGIEHSIAMLPTPFDDPKLISEYSVKTSISGTAKTVIVFVNADMWVTDAVIRGRINNKTQNVIAVWAWEIEYIPNEYKKISAGIDSLYALSKFSAEALSSGLNKKVNYFPTFFDFDLQVATKSENTEIYELSLTKYILYRFDAKSIVNRKNPIAALTVWQKISNEFPEYHLVLKTTDLNNEAHSEILRLISAGTRIKLINKVMTREETDLLMKNASVYLTLHRAEGLGLNILEAIGFDVPVVSTNYSGLSSELFNIVYPVKYSLIAIGEDSAPYPANGVWAEPDQIDAERQLRQALKDVNDGTWERNHSARKLVIDELLISNILLLEKLIEKHSKDKAFKKYGKLFSLAISNYLVSRILFISYKLLMRSWIMLPQKTRQKYKPLINGLLAYEKVYIILSKLLQSKNNSALFFRRKRIDRRAFNKIRNFIRKLKTK